MGILDRFKERRAALSIPERVEAARTATAALVAARLVGRAAEREIAVAPPVSRLSAVLHGKLRERVDEAKKRANPGGYAEINRIIGMTVLRDLSKEEIDAVSRQELDAAAYERGDRLLPPQAAAVLAYDECEGLFADVGVGWGKTGIDFEVAIHAYRKGLKRILLLVPAQAYSQLVHRDRAWWRSRISMGMPFMDMGETTQEKRLEIANSGKKGCYILPYSCLSTKDTNDVLFAIKPQLIIADEAHFLGNPRAARTKRIVHYCEEFFPEFVCLSGTMTRKKIIDYHHLVRLALKNRCPLPLSPILASEWGLVLDTGAEPTEAQTGPIRPLVDWAREKFPEGFETEDGKKVSWTYDVTGFRRAFQYRRNYSPGVVSTGDNEIATSLIIANRKVEGYEKVPGWDLLKKHLDNLEKLWITPNGDEIEHSIHTFKWAYELNAGFYNELKWPEPPVLAERRGCDEQVAFALLEAGKEHHTAKQIYSKLLRNWLDKHARPGLDTPMTVGGNMSQHGARNVGKELYDAWRGAKDLEFDAMPERDSTAIRVCSFKVDFAVKWALSLPRNEGALLWVFNREMGDWVYEALVAAGCDRALHCPAGHNDEITDPANAGKIVVASITAHGESKNLQHFFNQFYVQWPRAARWAEQSIGRTHRNGQPKDTLVIWTCNTLLFDDLNFAATLNDALYVAQTTGSRQKIIYSVYDPLPKIFPTEVLREKGFETHALSKEQKKLLHEKFSESS